MKTPGLSCCIGVTLLLVPLAAVAQIPVGTAITYHGQLQQGGQPVTGTVDMQFSLWGDPNTTSGQIGTTVVCDGQPGNLPVIEVGGGLFTARPDFGPDIFHLDARWLEIAVRYPHDPSDTAPYVTLLPRQELSPTPFALALPGVRTQQNDTCANVIGGYAGNTTHPSAVGQTISGGGFAGGFNRVVGSYGTIGGGFSNKASQEAVVAGGRLNHADALRATIAGGYYNTVDAQSGTIGGGERNTAGAFATVPGGIDNDAEGVLSLAAGYAAWAAHDGSFVWSDSTGDPNAPFASTAANQFLIRATGGVGINKPDPLPGTFDVAGKVRCEQLQVTENPTAGYVLTADGDGNAAWAPGGTGGTSLWSQSGSDIYYNAGHVGIGDAAPGDPLSVADDGNGGFIRVTRDPNSLGGLNWYEDTEREWIFPFFRGWQSDNLIVRDEAALRDVMTFEALTGDVGIGISNPEAPLHIVGGADATLAGGGYQIIGNTTGRNMVFDDNEIMVRDNGAGGTLRVQAEGGNIALCDGGGFVGIGTSQPKHHLHVVGDYYGRGHLYLHAYQGDGNDGTAYVQARDDSGTSDIALELRTQEAGVPGTVMRLTPEGNVGIGTFGPTARLHADDTATGELTYPVKVSNTGGDPNTAAGIVFQVDSGGEPRGKGALVYERMDTWNRGAFHFLQNSDANTALPDLSDAAMTITNGGNVGIGCTTPEAPLHIVGGADATITDGGYLLLGDSTSRNMVFDDNEIMVRYQGGTGKLRMQADGGDIEMCLGGGNVGIGTGTPGAKLHVSGTPGVDGIMFPDGTLQTTAGGGSGGGISGGGTTGYIAKFAGSTSIANSVLFETGGNVGVGTDTPGTKLDIDGSARASSSSDTYARLAYGRDGAFAQSEYGYHVTFSTGAGVRGHNTSTGHGVRGTSDLGVGMYGKTDGTGSEIFEVAGVYGVAGNLDADSYAAGGHFRASGGEGSGVVARATGEHGVGVSARSTGEQGTAILARAEPTIGLQPHYAGRFEATGATGTAIYAEGSHAGQFQGEVEVDGNTFITGGLAVGSETLDAKLKVECSSGYGLKAVANHSYGTAIFAMGGPDGNAADLRGNVRIFDQSTNDLVMELGTGLDFAEGFDVSASKTVEPGTVLVIDPDEPGKLTISSTAYDRKVAGIVAGANGLGSGVRLGAGQFDHNVALAGRVYCNVDARYGAVEPGDLLTTSPTPGFAMKVTDHTQAQGAILGKAMEALAADEQGQILVLVTLQ